MTGQAVAVALCDTCTWTCYVEVHARANAHNAETGHGTRVVTTTTTTYPAASHG